jgi:hypothetical protein
VARKPRDARQLDLAESKVVPLPRKAGPAPENLAKKAMQHEPKGASGKKVKLTLTVFLTPEQAESLTARAIKEGKNLGTSSPRSLNVRDDAGSWPDDASLPRSGRSPPRSLP